MKYKGGTAFCVSCDQPFRMRAVAIGGMVSTIACPYCEAENSCEAGRYVIFQLPPQQQEIFRALRDKRGVEARQWALGGGEIFVSKRLL